MSKIVVLGAGIAGHVAATHLRRKLSKKHEIVAFPRMGITSGYPPTYGSVSEG